MKLGINIDHVATVRNARGGQEPEPLTAVALAEMGGADQITIHLREDRRHILDRDLRLIREMTQVPLNLEMAATSEMVGIALGARPDQVTLVPEKREEKTTEGGLDLNHNRNELEAAIAQLEKESIPVILFVEPDNQVVASSKELGARGVELHTGAYANASSQKERDTCLEAIREAAELAVKLGLWAHAGHGLNYTNVKAIAKLPLAELNIGHSVISRALFVGLEQAVRDMKTAMQKGSQP